MNGSNSSAKGTSNNKMRSGANEIPQKRKHISKPKNPNKHSRKDNQPTNESDNDLHVSNQKRKVGIRKFSRTNDAERRVLRPRNQKIGRIVFKDEVNLTNLFKG